MKASFYRCCIIFLLCAVSSFMYGNTFTARNDTLTHANLEFCRSRNNEAMICYNNGDYTKAVECWYELLDFNYPPAITNLGIAYMNGAGVDRNHKRAYDFFCKAVEMNEAAAFFHLGTMYKLGIYVEQNDSVAFSCYNSSAKQGNTAAMNVLGKFYQSGTYVVKDNLAARKWLRLSALNDDVEGLYLYGVLLATVFPDYVDQDLGSALNCIYRAARMGHRESQILLIDDALQNEGYHQAYRWAKVLYNNGDNVGTKLLADCYRYGYGVRRDRKRARDLYRQAADAGNDEARKILEKW